MPGPAPARLALAALLGGLAGCVAPPAVRVDVAHGRVRAPSRTEAVITAGLLDDLHGRVRAVLPGTEGDDVEVWVQRELRMFWWATPAPEVNAINYRPWGRLHVERDSTSLVEDLTHELVHLLLDRSWRAIPPAIEEGLADHVAQALAPEHSPRIRAFRLIDAYGALGPLELVFRLPGRMGETRLVGPTPADPTDPSRVFAGRLANLSPHSHSTDKGALYGLGYLAVERIVDRCGYAGLHALCVDAAERGLASVPPEELAAAAELPLADRAAWRAAIRGALGRAELCVLAEQQGDAIAALLRTAFADRDDPGGGVAFLEAEEPLLSLGRGGAEIPLVEIPGLREALRRAWPARPLLAATTIEPSAPLGAPAHARGAPRPAPHIGPVHALGADR